MAKIVENGDFGAEVERPRVPSEPERRLWLMVIRRAQLDARGEKMYLDTRDEMRYKDVGLETVRLQRLAKNYLRRASRSLVKTCAFAGIGEDGVEVIVENAREGEYGE